MNRSGVHRYQKKLLASFPRQRELRKLLSNQFQRSLIPLLEDIPSPTYNDLLAAFGPPEEMAKTLLQGIDLPPPPSPKKGPGSPSPAASPCSVWSLGCSPCITRQK